MKEVSSVRHQVNVYCTVTEARPSKKLRVGCGPHEALCGPSRVVSVDSIVVLDAELKSNVVRK